MDLRYYTVFCFSESAGIEDLLRHPIKICRSPLFFFEPNSNPAITLSMNTDSQAESMFD